MSVSPYWQVCPYMWGVFCTCPLPAAVPDILALAWSPCQWLCMQTPPAVGADPGFCPQKLSTGHPAGVLRQCL